MKQFLIILFLYSFLPLSGRSDVKLPTIFGDHMVLQQGMPIPVWGVAQPGEQVTVSLAGKRTTTTTDDDGRWMVKLDPLSASTASLVMEVSARNKLIFKNVLIGEVWVCAGQSNMAASKRNLVSDEVGETGQIRFYKTPNVSSLTPRDEIPGNWVVCSPDRANSLFFSAVGYYFAVDIHKVHGTPVGMIQCTWSGTAIEPWINQEAWENEGIFQKVMDSLEATRVRARAKNEATPGKLDAEGENVERFSRTPTGIFNAMINPHIPYGIKGVIWYQGESNAKEEKQATQYETLFPMLIAGWRSQWGEGDFPFLYVQLPGYTTDRAWARLRQSQLKTLSAPNTGMAVTLDLNPTDNLHPPNKTAVGQRLALLARKIAYGENLLASGPRYDSMTVQGNKIRLRFSEVGGGLMIGEPPADYRPAEEESEAKAELLGFEVAGSDGQFVPAHGQIENDTVLIWSDQVPQPVSARYAWANRPLANLYNKEGLPASPFRTDE